MHKTTANGRNFFIFQLLFSLKLGNYPWAVVCSDQNRLSPIINICTRNQTLILLRICLETDFRSSQLTENFYVFLNSKRQVKRLWLWMEKRMLKWKNQFNPADISHFHFIKYKTFNLQTCWLSKVIAALQKAAGNKSPQISDQCFRGMGDGRRCGRNV